MATVDFFSLVSRRQDLYRFLPEGSQLLEIGIPEHADEPIEADQFPERLFVSTVQEVARLHQWLRFGSVVILPGYTIEELPGLVAVAMPHLRSDGWLAIGGTYPVQAIDAVMAPHKLDALVRLPWKIGSGSNWVGRRPHAGIK